MRQRLLVLTSSFPRWAGDDATPFVLHFAQNMAREYGKVLVVAPHYRGARVRESLGGDLTVGRFRYFLPYAQEDIAYGGNAVARVHWTPLYASKLVLFLVASFVTVIRSRARLINVHWLIPQGLVATAVKWLTGARVVVTVHGGDVFSLNSGLFARIKRIILKNADAVVANSSATAEACRSLYPSRDYQIIPMGIDTDRFAPRPKSAELVRRHDLDDFTILFVGRLTADKGLEDLLRGLHLLQASGTKFRALIVGTGDQEPELKRLAGELELGGDVEFVGWVANDELGEYYNTADVFVGPSVVGSRGWQEALGLVFVEALATGLPVISTKTGGIADVVDDGRTGFLVDQRSPQQICDRLRQLHGDRELLRELGDRARATVEERFSWTTVSRRYLALFEALSG